MKLKVEYIKIGELKPYEKNARKHQKEDVETIKASIEEFGMCDPIGIWGKENTIVEGHGRLKKSSHRCNQNISTGQELVEAKDQVNQGSGVKYGNIRGTGGISQETDREERINGN